jgi:sterol desaturase/sphingolipid hydroxylase (fatty acid hydroxylase superfamily)
MVAQTPAFITDYRGYKREQAKISRGRLYPVTVFYTAYSVLMLTLGLRSAHPRIAIFSYLMGFPVWSLVEYFFHRYVLHGRFKKSERPIKKYFAAFANKVLDPLHWEHHERPNDGMHINGVLKDLLPLFAVAAPLSFIFPLYTTPMLLAGTIQGYVSEEWIHHAIHFFNFKNKYFRYVKRHHLYHHSSRGITRGFGITNGIWDVVFRSRFDDPPRKVWDFRSREKLLKSLESK